MRFSRGDKVVTVDGNEGKVTFTDTARNKVAVEITKPGTIGRNKGDQVAYNADEVKKR